MLQAELRREALDSEPPPLQPVKASLTPMYTASGPRSAEAETESVSEAEPVEPAAAIAPGLIMRFVQDSWFEVLGPDGDRIESGIARAGEERRFPRSSVGKVSLGNAGGVEVGLDGQIVDLTPYRRANVARFALSSAGSVLPNEG
jgi:cytoskeleton protein RodZ